MSSRILARTLMSSIETGSSATSSDRVEDDGARDHRPLLLAAREVGRVLVHELLGRREPDALEHLGRRCAAARARSAGSPWICSGCADRLRRSSSPG